MSHKSHPSTSDCNLRIEDEKFPHGFTMMETLTSSKIFKENIKSDAETDSQPSTPSENNPILKDFEPSLIAQYDEMIRTTDEVFENDLLEAFLSFAEHQELCRIEWLKSVQECRRLQTELDKANHEIGDFANKLQNARRMFDQEKKLRQSVEIEKNKLEQQMVQARELLNKNFNRISDDTKEKLAFLNCASLRSHTNFDKKNVNLNTRLNTINETNSEEIINSTSSILSDISFSYSEDMNNSTFVKLGRSKWKRSLNTTEVPTLKKQKSKSHKLVEINPNDKIVATTTLSLSKDGPITATSVIEAVPSGIILETPASNEIKIPISTPSTHSTEDLCIKQKSSTTSLQNRPHAFIAKTMLCPVTCDICQKRIRFGKIAAKCKACRSICHSECKPNLPLPCIPMINTPPKKENFLANYCSTIPPMVPPLIIYCINEIELRGLKEVGIYRISGLDRDIKTLKNKFLRSKSHPNLNNIDIHVLCGIVKEFLRSLNEPLVTYSMRKDFMQAAEAKDEMDVISCIYQAISQLPQPNRDTLAYIMLHLNRVAKSKKCRMPADNLAKIFGPTIVGYSAEDIEPQSLLLETKQLCMVMDHLMKIPTDFWLTYINIDSTVTTPRSKIISETTSTVSVVHSNKGKYFIPVGYKKNIQTKNVPEPRGSNKKWKNFSIK